LKIQCDYDFCYEKYYYILIQYNNIGFDNHDVSKLLNIFYSDYLKIIFLNNGFYRDGYPSFHTQEDCQKCIEYIKENYNDRLVYLALIENTEKANKLIKAI
jgi:nitrogen regulatory protein PII-like uncharacterized protein